MKKIIIVLVGAIFIIAGFVNAGIPEENFENKLIEKISINKPIIEEYDEFAEINIIGSDYKLFNDGKPVIPKILKTYTFPFGTKIKNVVCNIKNINQIKIDKEIIPTPIAISSGGQLENNNDDINQELNDKMLIFI